MGIAPDEAIAQMAAELANGVRDLNEAFEQLATGARAAATEAADRAAQSQSRVESSRVESSRVEKVYRQSMSALVAVVNLREVAAKRELYRRLARTSDDLREVAERVWYSVLKES
jgi:hypothetical protein